MNLNPQYKLLFAMLVVGMMSFFLTPAMMQEMNRAVTEPIREPRLVIKKKDRVLELYDGHRLVKTYAMVLGFSPEGDKGKEGDGRTPEGDFYVFTKNSKSRFHLSLGLSYPSKDDAVRGLAEKIITRAEHDEIVKAIDAGKMPPQKTALGGEIYIHGGGVGSDWTWGCVALKNEEIEELYHLIGVGTKVAIRP